MHETVLKQIGADGYCLKTMPMQQLELAINATACGATLLDPGIAGRVLQALPKQSSACHKVSKGADLSDREIEVLQLVIEGCTHPQIADRLCLCPETVKTRVSHVLEKLCVSDRTHRP